MFVQVSPAFADWAPSRVLPECGKRAGLGTLIQGIRKRQNLRGEYANEENSYFVSNTQPAGQRQADELLDAIRQHWRIEAMHHLRDVPFSEDAYLNQPVLEFPQWQLLGALQGGTPIMVGFRNAGTNIGHNMLITGWQDNGNTLILLDPETGSETTMGFGDVRASSLYLKPVSCK